MSDGAKQRWYVLRTQVKKERAAAAQLAEIKGVEVFFPKLRYLKATRRGKVWWVEPLFPGYLLARFNHEEMGRLVTYSQGVSKIVTFGSAIPEVPESFVESLREEVNRLQNDQNEIVVGWKVEPGQEVEIADGPFQGIRAEVAEIRPGGERAGILMEFLGETKMLEVDLLSLILSNPDIPEELQG